MIVSTCYIILQPIRVSEAVCNVATTVMSSAFTYRINKGTEVWLCPSCKLKLLKDIMQVYSLWDCCVSTEYDKCVCLYRQLKNNGETP